MINWQTPVSLNPLTAGLEYIRVFHFLLSHKVSLSNMLQIKRDVNQKDLKIVNFHFV